MRPIARPQRSACLSNPMSAENIIVPAVAYVRMSTEHQQYSTDNQSDVVRAYAERRHFNILRTYSDEGKSGLNIRGRDSLGNLIKEIEAGKADFKAILVYDISRWGRFQDADESAYYEYVCKRAGVAVHYCAEQFENDGSPVSTIVKGVKRAMAGEYSRELSTKVFQGACRLVQLGYRQGGMAGFGLRRMLIDQSGEQKGLLGIGEHKSIQTDRVILVPGPPDEIETVRWMYSVFVKDGWSESSIASDLNRRGIMTNLDRSWTRATVHEVLTNEKYLGNNVYHRTSCKLKKRHISNPEEMWVRANGVFEGIIDEHHYFTARGIILARSRKLSDDEMLGKLRGVLEKHGRLSGFIIDEAEDMPSSCAFRNRFGSLVGAYKLIGYEPDIDYAFIEINRHLRSMYPEVVSGVVEKLRSNGATVFTDSETDLLWINGEITTSLVIARCSQTGAGSSRWTVRLDEKLRPDITIVARMDEENQSIRDYYLLPAIDMTWERLRMAEENGFSLDSYRFPSLDYFFQLAKRKTLEDAA